MCAASSAHDSENAHPASSQSSLDHGRSFDAATSAALDFRTPADSRPLADRVIAISPGHSPTTAIHRFIPFIASSRFSSRMRDME